jgi:hypothetical protein
MLLLPRLAVFTAGAAAGAAGADKEIDDMGEADGAEGEGAHSDDKSCASCTADMDSQAAPPVHPSALLSVDAAPQGLGVIAGHACAQRIADIVRRTADAFCVRLHMLEGQFTPSISTGVNHGACHQGSSKPPSAPDMIFRPSPNPTGPSQRVRRQYLAHAQVMPAMLALLSWVMLVVEAHVWGEEQRAGCSRETVAEDAGGGSCGVVGKAEGAQDAACRLLNKIHQFVVPFSCCVLEDPVTISSKGGKKSGQGKAFGNYAVATKHWLALIREKGVHSAISAYTRS